LKEENKDEILKKKGSEKEEEEIEQFLKKKEIQNHVLKKIIEKINSETVKTK
jgi:hypothetical protein